MNIQGILDQIKAVMAQLKTAVTVQNLNTPQGDRIYKYACTKLGIDASPNDLAPDELGCAETVTTILHALFADVPILLGTNQLFSFLKQSAKFSQVQNPLPGDVIISPTGFGGFNGITNGHTGIVGQNGVIMSNSSATGNFEQNYTIDTWSARYKIKGGYPVCFFRRILP